MLGSRHRHVPHQNSRPSRFGIAAASFLAFLLSSCQDSQEVALRDLVGRGFEFTVADYHRVASAGELEIVRLFHSAGMSPLVNAPDGTEALHQATLAGKSQIVKELLSQGVDPDSPTPQAETPAMLAADVGDAPTLRVLLSFDADLQRRNLDGWAPLTLAARSGHAEATAVLAPHCPELLDSALHLASQSGNESTIDALITSGASVHAVAAKGRTPIMQAATAGKDAAVAILISSGANPHAHDEKGLTASDLARKAGYPETALRLDKPPVKNVPPVKWKGTGLSSKVTDAYKSRPYIANQSVEYSSLTNEDRPQRLEGSHFDMALLGGHLTFKMIDLRQSFLPLELGAVDSSAGIAQVRLPGYSPPLQTISLGQEIADTGLTLTNIDSRVIHPDGRNAPPMDASRITVESSATGEKHLIAKGFPARSSALYVLLKAGVDDLRFYDARAGDSFTAGVAETMYQVMSIRPDHLLLLDVSKGREIRISRENRVAGF